MQALSATREVRSPSPRQASGSVFRLHARNRLVDLGDAALLVNLESGAWLRLTPAGARLVRELTANGSLAGGRPMDAASGAATAALIETLIRGRFASRAQPEAPAPRRAPLPWSRVMLNVTHRCNLRCSHCAVYADVPGRREKVHVRQAEPPRGETGPHRAVSTEAPTRLLLEIVERLAAQGTRTLIVFGGEPTVRRDLAHILRFAAARIPHLVLTTNGTLLSEELCRAAADCVQQVRVSLDGSSPDVNDAVRGAGSFARAVEGLERLRRHGHHGLVIRTVITRRNVQDAPHMVALARRLGAALEVTGFVALGRGARHRDQLLPSADELLRAHQCLWLLAEYYDVPSAGFGTFCARFMARAGVGCGSGCGSLLVDCGGDIFPCEALQHEPLRLGNVLAQRTGLPTASVLAGASVEEVPTCAACELRYFCRGGCLAEREAADAAGPPSSVCGFYRKVLPPVLRRFQPERSSWQNLETVFGGLDFSICREYLASGRGAH